MDPPLEAQDSPLVRDQLLIHGARFAYIMMMSNAQVSAFARLHDPVVTVSFTLTNTGSVAGTEVMHELVLSLEITLILGMIKAPQLYLSPPASANSAPFNLRGFDSVFLGPGESKTVSFSLSRYDFSVWDTGSQSWQIVKGTTGISVGASSRDLRLKDSIDN